MTTVTGDRGVLSLPRAHFLCPSITYQKVGSHEGEQIPRKWVLVRQVHGGMQSLRYHVKQRSSDWETLAGATPLGLRYSDRLSICALELPWRKASDAVIRRGLSRPHSYRHSISSSFSFTHMLQVRASL